MRTLLVCLLMLGGLAAAEAQTRVEEAKVVRRGLYEIGKVKAIEDQSITTGRRTEAGKITFQEHSQRIEVADGVVFGLDVMVYGRPNKARIPVRVVWRYPEPGMTNPDTGKTKVKDEYNDELNLGTEQTYYWSIGDKWQQVEGNWTFELWYRDRRLVKQEFEIVRR